jgi:hypothetical protein
MLLDPHTHDMNSRKLKVSYAVREKVEQYLKVFPSIPPKVIVENLESDSSVPNSEIPELKDLYNFLAQFKKKIYGKANMNLAELAKWCDQHSTIPSEEMLDEPFVLAYNCFYADEEYEDHEPGDIFRFVITTRRLLLLLGAGLKFIQTDATYKLIWNGFPVFMIGTSDALRAFFPIVIGVCSNERHFDFKFLFESLQKGISL